MSTTRREMLLGSAAGATALVSAADDAPPAKPLRIGVVSAAIRGKPQPRNGHTWHFAQYFHPTVNLDAAKKYLDPGSAKFFKEVPRNPKFNFDQLPFPDTKITLYYDADPKVIGPY